MLSFHRIFLAVSTSVALTLCILIIAGPTEPKSETHPELADISRIFITDSAFVRWDNTTSEKWNAVLPSNFPLEKTGLVITTDLKNGSHTWSDMSLSHQLRCLVFIRQELMFLASSASYVSTFRDHRGEDSPYNLVAGCFDYLRQSILCAADSTYIPSFHETEAEGNGLWRTCKDSEPLFEWMRLSLEFGEPSVEVI